VTAGLTALAGPATAAVSAGSAATAAEGTAAAGTPGCDALVLDGAHMLGTGNGARAAATALGKAHHATVRVRTYRSVPRGDLDAAVAAEVRRCASWHDRHGRRRADLLVLAVSLDDHRTGIYYGSGWAAALAHRQEGVQTGTVNPLLRRGKYAAAVTGGLAALGRLMPNRPGAAPQPVDPGSGGTEDLGTDPDGVVSDPDLPAVDGPDYMPSSLGSTAAAVAGWVAAAGVLVVVAATMAFGGGLASSGRRSARSWRSGNGSLGSGLGASTFGDSSAGSFGSFSGGSDAGSSSSAGSSSDGGGSSTSW
jgi:uncharacterized membrane protein YgcG